MLTIPTTEVLNINEEVVIDKIDRIVRDNTFSDSTYTTKRIRFEHNNLPVNLTNVVSVERKIVYLLTDNPGICDFPVYGIRLHFIMKTHLTWWFRTEEEREQHFYALGNKASVAEKNTLLSK